LKMLKKLYYSLINGNIITSFIFCYIALFLFGVLLKLLSFSFGYGDIFYSMLNFFRGTLDAPSSHFNSLISFIMFLGSFYGLVIGPMMHLFFIFIYAAAIQFVLYVFIKRPKRFSITLSTIFTTMAFFYVLNLVPFIGPLAYVCCFIYFVSRELGKQNSFSTGKGVFVIFVPFLLVLFFAIIAFASVAGLVSLF